MKVLVANIEDVKMATSGYPNLTAPTVSICDHQDPVCAWTWNWPNPPDVNIAVHTSYGATDYVLLGRRLAQLMAS